MGKVKNRCVHVYQQSRNLVTLYLFKLSFLCLIGKGNNAKVDPTKVTARAAVLLKYLDHSAEFELQALYALQALVHKLEHPPGKLETVRFRLLA